MGIKFLLVAEIAEAGDDEARAQELLDAFRESVLPSSEYGLTIYRATAQDLQSFGVTPPANYSNATPGEVEPAGEGIGEIGVDDPSQTLYQARKQVAEEEFGAYDFGDWVVKDTANWVEESPTCWIRTVYFEDPDDPDGPSVTGQFKIIWEEDTSLVQEVDFRAPE
jgi:hypothetical protein